MARRTPRALCAAAACALALVLIPPPAQAWEPYDTMKGCIKGVLDDVTTLRHAPTGVEWCAEASAEALDKTCGKALNINLGVHFIAGNPAAVPPTEDRICVELEVNDPESDLYSGECTNELVRFTASGGAKTRVVSQELCNTTHATWTQH